MSDGPHTLLLASAGTGKTWRLTGRALELLLDGVAPERILATTFTRKAAGEILERVLERLVVAAEGAAGLGALREALGRPRLAGDDCVALLARLVRHLDRLQVRTLDSFFGHVVRLFALDLDLPPEWAIAEQREDEEMVLESIGRVLGELGEDERVALYRALQRESAGRAVTDALQRVVADFRAPWLESAEGAWDCLPTLAPLGDEDLAAAVARLAELPLPTTQKGAPRKNWATGVANVLEAAAGGDWEGLLSLTLVRRAVADPAQAFDRAAIEGDWLELLRALAGHAAAEALARLTRQNEATRAFLARFEATFVTLKRERGRYRFEDMPLALAPGGPTGTRPIEERELDLWFRLDGRVDHVLLDEFQDTAPMQWRVLQPLVEEILSEGDGARSFFCVGDVKQSIYGWRAAEPGLLRELDRRYEVLRPPETMATSYRSSPVVLGAVNALFGAIDGNPVFELEQAAPYAAAAARWRAGFEQHDSARAALPGCVELREAPPATDGEHQGLPALRLAADRVAALVAEAPGATVGVLVRSNKPIPRLIYLLRARGVRASGEGGNPLTDSSLVLAALSMLHLADHPGDSAAAFHLETSALAAASGFDPNDPRGFARALRARLVREGYGATLGTLAGALEQRADAPAWELARLAQLVELAHRHDADAGLRPSTFVDLVRTERVDDPAAARVRVMTVHAAKGLEFDAVVLPELHATLPGRYKPVLALRSDPFEAYDRVTNAPRKEVAAALSELSSMREEVRGQQVEEALSLLYVATTRARRRLEWIVPWRDPQKSEPPFSFAGFLRAGLCDGEPPEEGVLWRAPGSSADWCADLRQAPAPGEVPVSARLVLADSRAPRSPESRSPSAEEGDGGAAELLRRRERGATRRGTLVHRWLEQLEWIEDFALDDATAHELGRALEPEEQVRAAALALLRRGLEGPELRAALARDGRPGDLEHTVERERRFRLLLPDAGGVPELWSGSIDRLVVSRRDGEPVAAEVQDYKTDEVDAEGLGARAAVYRPQLEAYRRAAAALLDLDPAAVRARLLFLAVGAVVDL